MQTLKNIKHGSIDNITNFRLVHPNTKAEPCFRVP